MTTENGHSANEAVVEAMRLTMHSSHPADAETAEAILDALRALPVEQRMEAMGMEHVGWIDEYGQHWGIQLRNGAVESDRRTYASEGDRDHV